MSVDLRNWGEYISIQIWSSFYVRSRVGKLQVGEAHSEAEDRLEMLGREWKLTPSSPTVSGTRVTQWVWSECPSEVTASSAPPPLLGTGPEPHTSSGSEPQPHVNVDTSDWSHHLRPSIWNLSSDLQQEVRAAIPTGMVAKPLTANGKGEAPPHIWCQ